MDWVSSAACIRVAAVRVVLEDYEQKLHCQGLTIRMSLHLSTSPARFSTLLCVELNVLLRSVCM